MRVENDKAFTLSSLSEKPHVRIKFEAGEEG
jgi:hypothetical protein